MKEFNSIALSFSGGGYRAAAFSLGILSFLEQIDLLKKVSVISTVSGGTITGISYSLSQANGLSFDDFFKDYYVWLLNDKLLEHSFYNYNNNEVWKHSNNKHKTKNLINAFAISYNNFFDHKTLGYIENAIINNKTHLKRVSFNATDFSNGKIFRFQNVKGTSYKFGNQNAHKYKKLIEEIKLGDILAASTAFPGAFEPINFPKDFIPSKEDSNSEIGLLDGGIIDNQGGSAFISSKKGTFDLIFMADSASQDMTAFKFSRPNRLFKRAIGVLFHPILLIFNICATAIFFYLNQILFYSLFLAFTTLTIVLQASLRIGMYKLISRTGKKLKLNIQYSLLVNYLSDRIFSLIKMSQEVFLKNDRTQNTREIYRKYYGNAITATIYELRCKENNEPDNATKWNIVKELTGDIPENIRNISLECFEFETTLWFPDENNKEKILNNLIACGEFTACYNLIAYLAEFYNAEVNDPNHELFGLMEILIDQWKQFKAKPNFLIKYRL